MKNLFISLAFLAIFAANLRAENLPNFEKFADAIYKAEGGAKAKKPYGILSIAVRDEAHARRICINTVRNNFKRWQAAGRPGEFVDFLADRFCPPSCDPVGNRNWKKNVKALTK